MPSPFYQEVFAEGVALGRAEAAEARGARRLLLVLLRSRFGALPARVKKRVERAERAQVEAWGERLLTAVCLADVFRPAGRAAAEAKVQGERRLLVLLVRARFGPLPVRVQERVERAAPAQVEAWGERLLTAAGLADVFRPARGAAKA